jgi:hypothetical protein
VPVPRTRSAADTTARIRHSVRVTIKRTCLVVTLTAITASPTSGCSSWGCNKGFELDYTRDASGPATPRAALARWLIEDDEGAPDTGWRRTRAASTISFRNGQWEVTVVKAPGGGYLVQSGSCEDAR